MNLCYLGNSPEEYTEYRKVFPQVETLFLCSNYLMVRHLQEHDEQAQVYDDHVPTDRGWAALKWLDHLLENWFFDSEGNDLSSIGEISLGTVSQTNFAWRLLEAMRRVLSIECGIALYRPQVLAWGASLGDEWHNTCFNLARPLGVNIFPLEATGPEATYLPQLLAPVRFEAQVDGNARKFSFRLWQWLTSKYALVQDTISDTSPGHPHDILALNYSPLEPIWNEWNHNRELRKRVRLGFLSNNPPGKSVAIRALFRGCAVYPIESQSMHPTQNNDVETTIGKMNTLMDSEVWRQRLSWDRADLSPILTPLFQKAVALIFPIAASWTVSLETAVQRRHPRAVILPYTDPVIPQILRQLASKYRFKTVYIPHGNEVTTQPELRSIYGGTLNVDRIIATGEKDRETYMKSGASPDKVVALGFFPAQRAIDYALSHASSHQAAKRDGQVLVLDHGRSSFPYFKERTVEDYFFKVLDLLARLGYRQITYKVHMGAPQIEYYEELKRYITSPVDVTIVKDTSIYELMAQAEFIVGPISSGIFEAAVLDTPYLIAHFDGLPLWPPLDTEEVPVAHDYKSLSEMIQSYRNNWPTARRALLRDGCGLDPDEPLKGTSLPKKLLDDLSAWLDTSQKQNNREPQPW